MKKKVIIFSIAVVLIIAVSACVWLLLKPQALGSINHTCNEPTTAVSNISFDGQGGNKIKFSFVSDITDGNLDIVLYNVQGDEVYRLDKAKELETYFTLDNTGEYILAAEYEAFAGSFKVEIFKVD
mgnify:CR=1 FL=1